MKLRVMARKENKACYLYHPGPNGENAYGAMVSCRADWLAKAWPGGRVRLSIRGNARLRRESEN